MKRWRVHLTWAGITAVVAMANLLPAGSTAREPNGSSSRSVFEGAAAAAGVAQDSGAAKWKKGTGWGWIWGKGDQIGALNALSDESRRAALQIAKQGRAFDLGVVYDRGSYKWPGHSPGEIISFRTPEGVKRQQDLPALVGPNVNRTGTAWHSNALFLNDNVATQVDCLGHVTEGPNCRHGDIENHWYNGFKEADWGGNWGPRRCDAASIPPIIARGVLIDVAGFKKVDVLPPNYEITPNDLQEALRAQGTELQVGDVVLIRTGTLRFWGDAGNDPDGKIKMHDSAGINIDAARWLVEEHGPIMIGADTSGLEYVPTDADNDTFRSKHGTFIPVHTYLLIHQGVYIGEFHNLEDLARERIYEFCYVCCTNKIKGAVAGFTLRPLALR